MDVYTEYDGGIRRCGSCGYWTSRLEAELRIFRTGRCGQCGGVLRIVMDRDYSSTSHHDPGDEDPCR